MDETRYQIEDVDQIISPSLVVFRETLEENLAEMVRIAGDPARLRPHCKTHKMAQVVELQLAHGITRHKCATFAEAEMLVAAGVEDVFHSIEQQRYTRVIKSVGIGYHSN